MTAGIVVENLDKHFGSFKAVDDVSFEADEGKITALLGPSGSGKSTVLRMIAGLETPDCGRIRLATRRYRHQRPGSALRVRLPAFRAVPPHDRARRTLASASACGKRRRRPNRGRVNELLELVQLAPFADRYPDQLSGGQRQRVALARALAAHPKVLLLDEPFGALDARVRQELRSWLDELHRELGVTSLLVTHDQEEALELAQRIVVMHQGQVEQVGSPTEIYNHPATRSWPASWVGERHPRHRDGRACRVRRLLDRRRRSSARWDGRPRLRPTPRRARRANPHGHGKTASAHRAGDEPGTDDEAAPAARGRSARIRAGQL